MTDTADTRTRSGPVIRPPIFEDPPASARGGARTSVWMEILAPLVEHPNKWANVQEYDTERGADHSAGNLRRDKTPKPPGRWHFTTRARKPEQVPPNGSSTLYAVYLGPDEEPLPERIDPVAAPAISIPAVSTTDEAPTYVATPGSVTDIEYPQAVPFHDEPVFARDPEVEPDPEPGILAESDPGVQAEGISPFAEMPPYVGPHDDDTADLPF